MKRISFQYSIMHKMFMSGIPFSLKFKTDWLFSFFCGQVLAQQRAEQQRRDQSQQPPQGDQPLDPVTFIQTLPSELRRSVLEDMEDSVLAVMPPDIAAEAAALRREQEARQRQLMHERLFGHSSSSALSAILRSPAFTSRLGGNRGVQYTRLAVQRGGTFQMGSSSNHSRSVCIS